MTDTVRVPLDLLDGLLQPRHQRLIVTAWVLCGGEDPERQAFYAARDRWPANWLARANRPSVLSILLELEQLGACEVLGEDEGFITVLRERRAGAA